MPDPTPSARCQHLTQPARRWAVPPAVRVLWTSLVLIGCAAPELAQTPAGLGSQTAPATAATYRLDPAHSFVHFEVAHFGTSTTRGRLGPADGEVTLDPARGRGEARIRIPVHSVSTGIAVFDARLRRADLLDTEAHPEAYFVATQFRFEGSALREVRGEFTLRGVSQPLSLQVRRFGCATLEGAEVCGGDFEGEVLRSSVGASFGLPLVGDRVRLFIQVQGRRM